MSLNQHREPAFNPTRVSGISVLGATSWDAPLNEFATATGVTVSLFDTKLNRVSGPHATSTLATWLQALGFWQPGRLGAQEELAAAERVLISDHVQLHRVLDLLEVCAVPARLDGRTVGVFVSGWTPFQFSDLIRCDQFAIEAGLPQGEFWSRMRLQAPLTDRKLTTFGQMLETLATALLKQVHDSILEKQTSVCLRILNEASLALTSATTYVDIGKACSTAVERLLPGMAARILVTDHAGSLTELPSALGPSGDPSKIIKLPGESRHACMVRAPIQAADGSLLGVIEALARGPVDEPAIQNELAPLAAQIAVALQKVHLISDLEHERSSLDQAIAELKRVSRIRDEFLATISHELRTPLNSMLGWCQLLRSGGLDDSEKSEALETIERNATAQAHLIDDLLDMSRVITGKLLLDRRPTNLVDVLNLSINAIRPAAEAKAIKVRTDFRRVVLPFVGDALRLQQIFWNLLANAVKFTPEGGRITATAEVSEGRIVVRVADSGKGIRSEFLGRVFDRFSQEDGSYTRRFGGLGLGLAIVRHLVEMHGGEVDVQSQGEGLGATFSVTLPLNSAFRAGDDDSDEGTTLLAGRHILAVEDDLLSLKVLRATLESTGADVKVATSAGDALRIVGEWLPDLIISDIGLPGQDGYDLIRRVRALPADSGGSIPAFALTAYNSPGDKVQALEAGYQRHLDKPLNREHLLSALKDFSTKGMGMVSVQG